MYREKRVQQPQVTQPGFPQASLTLARTSGTVNKKNGCGDEPQVVRNLRWIPKAKNWIPKIAGFVDVFRVLFFLFSKGVYSGRVLEVGSSCCFSLAVKTWKILDLCFSTFLGWHF